MATWQIGYRLVPRDAIATAFGHVPESIALEQYESRNWWTEFDLDEEFVHRLDAILPRRPSWSAELLAWGVDDGNRVDVWTSIGEINEVTARVDARDPHQFATTLSVIGGAFKLLGVTDEYRLHELSSQQVLMDVIASPAAQFVDNPKKFLTDLKHGHHLNLE
jgi:hypothetical protein